MTSITKNYKNKAKEKAEDNAENPNTNATDNIAHMQPAEKRSRSLKTLDEGQQNILDMNIENTVQPELTEMIENISVKPNIIGDGEQSILDAYVADTVCFTTTEITKNSLETPKMFFEEEETSLALSTENTIIKDFPETSNILEQTELRVDDTNMVVIKEEPMNEIDYDMPINKIKSHSLVKTAEITENCPEPPRIVAEEEQSILYENVASTTSSTSIEITANIPEPPKILDYRQQPISHQIRENILEPQAIKGAQDFTEHSTIPHQSEGNIFETHRVVIKEEPASEETEIENAQVFDNKSKTQLEKENLNNSPLDESLENLDLDAYLHDLITPVAPARPQIRVKAEFALQKSPQRESFPTNDFLARTSGVVVKTEILQPPPPPIFSSNSNLDFIAQGISTPKLSLLKVKSEFSCLPAAPTNNDNFLNDILANKEQNREEGEASSETSEDEHIPDDFFDDLLHDKLQERIEEAQNDDLEEKYSDRLKELKRLQKELKKKQKPSDARSKSHKKHKKPKKKSRKRARSRSFSPRSKAKASKLHHSSGEDKKHFPAMEPAPSSSRYVYRESERDFVKVYSGFQVKSEFSPYIFNNLEQTAEDPINLAEQAEEIVTVLTPEQKRERAVGRANTALNRLKENADESCTTFSSFPFVSTLRKLHTNKDVYRSPLGLVSNVSYDFNSLTPSVNVEKYGLVALPPASAELAELIGYDAQSMHNKLQTRKTVSKLGQNKLEQGAEAEVEVEEEKELLESISGELFSNVMTQTDVCQLNTSMTSKGYEVGIQTEPSVESVACQTLETPETPTDYDTLLTKLLCDLNENQLMAMHAFAELITEPKANGSAMDISKIQMIISDIYKISQMPSALATAKSRIVTNYAKNPITKQTNLNAKNVEGSVDQKFSESNRYPSTYDISSRSEDGHYYSGSSNKLPSSCQHNPPAYNNQGPSSTNKRYGRGAARR